MYGFRPTMTTAQISGCLVGFVIVFTHMLSVCTQGYTSYKASREMIQRAQGLIIDETQDYTFGLYRSLEGGPFIGEDSLEQALLRDGLGQETSVDISQRSEIMIGLSQSLFALAEPLVTKRSEVLIEEVIYPDRKTDRLQFAFDLVQDPDFITHLIDEFTLTDPPYSSWL